VATLGVGIVTECHNMDEFNGVCKSFIPKSVAIMQTDLCIADLEMLFTTLRTCANHTSWQENSALDETSCDVFPAGDTRIAALQDFKNNCYVNHALFQ